MLVHIEKLGKGLLQVSIDNQPQIRMTFPELVEMLDSHCSERAQLLEGLAAEVRRLKSEVWMAGQADA